jgi:hypothetical protein
MQESRRAENNFRFQLQAEQRLVNSCWSPVRVFSKIRIFLSIKNRFRENLQYQRCFFSGVFDFPLENSKTRSFFFRRL